MCACEAAVGTAAEASAQKIQARGRGKKREINCGNGNQIILALRQDRDVNGQSQRTMTTVIFPTTSYNRKELHHFVDLLLFFLPVPTSI